MFVPSGWRANELTETEGGGWNRRRVRGRPVQSATARQEHTGKSETAKRPVTPTGAGRVLWRAPPTMRDVYLQAALKVIDDPNILVNVISRRVKQLKRGNRALVESLEKLSPEDTALREVMEGKISYELATKEMLVHGGR